MSTLFDPIRIGDIDLATRVVMAPLTRNRASPGQVPNALMAHYYAQRANPATGAGLLITEATQISPMGQGYKDTPGIHSAEQVAGWRQVTDAVHAQGGRIVVQLWHVGRISHSSLLPGGVAPVSSTARAANVNTLGAEGRAPCSVPRALRTDEIPGLVADYAQAARNAIAAGFDGVEVHAANGYLIDQFLRDGSNHRTDDYGGSVQGRARFLLEVTEAVTGVWGKDRVGVRLSPSVAFNDMSDSDPAATFGYAAGELRGRLGYLHVIEGVGGAMAHRGPRLAPLLKQRFGGPLILNGGYDRDTAEAALAAGEAELISFGAPYLANPDLPARFLAGAPLNAPDQATFYSEGAKGYVDYPALAAG